MIRISSNLKDDLKKHAQKEGRTLEWVTNKAIEDFLYRPVTPSIMATPKFMEPPVTVDYGVSQDPADNKPIPQLGEYLREKGIV